MSLKITLACFFTVLGILNACSVQAPQDIVQTKDMAYEIEIHSFHANGTNVTFVFDGDKTLLIDCSSNRDPVLIQAYLQAQAVSHVEYIVCSEPPAIEAYPYPSLGTVFAVGATTDNGEIQPVPIGKNFALGASWVLFTETEEGPVAEVHYKSTTQRYALQTEAETRPETGNETVLIRKPDPDGKYTEIRFKSLQEILPEYDF